MRLLLTCYIPHAGIALNAYKGNAHMWAIMEASSAELINMLADLGYCKRHSGAEDTRKAYIGERGTFTLTGKSYIKIIVQVDDGVTYDFGVRLFV